MDIREHIRHIPDFPKPGILFYDISTLLSHTKAWRHTIDLLSVATRHFDPDPLVGIESRGFLVAAPLALQLGCGFVMCRKKGKLPGATVSHTYQLEYGSDTIEMQADAVRPGQRIIVMDDLLATGGTAAATVALLRKLGTEPCAAAFIIELTGLNGRAKLDLPVIALIQYEM